MNEVNASGGRVVTAPYVLSSNQKIKMWESLCDRTNGAAGVIPATLKYVTEFISQDPERE